MQAAAIASGMDPRRHQRSCSLLGTAPGIGEISEKHRRQRRHIAVIVRDEFGPVLQATLN